LCQEGCCRIVEVKGNAFQICSDADVKAGKCGPRPAARNLRNTKKDLQRIARFADMLSAMGTEPRLRIMQLLLVAHPKGLVVGDIQAELDIAASTLSHHLEKLKHEHLVTVRRDKKFLWYAANADALQELLGFLFAECCTRTDVVKAETIIQLCR
jgi:ArsR family transcriptional regulator, arsenate/arsenite/antimonite-responsive transcriptional repressor